MNFEAYIDLALTQDTEGVTSPAPFTAASWVVTIDLLTHRLEVLCNEAHAEADWSTFSIIGREKVDDALGNPVIRLSARVLGKE